MAVLKLRSPREGPILMGRDQQERQVHGRQCELAGVLAATGGLGGQVPPVLDIRTEPTVLSG